MPIAIHHRDAAPAAVCGAREETLASHGTEAVKGLFGVVIVRVASSAAREGVWCEGRSVRRAGWSVVAPENSLEPRRVLRARDEVLARDHSGRRRVLSAALPPSQKARYVGRG